MFGKILQSKDASSLMDLARVLMHVEDSLGALKDQDVVLPLGNTGCGKSTMLTSLIYGPAALAVTTQDVANSGRRAKKIKVISHKDQRDNFGIGHSDSEIRTLLPDFAQESTSKITFGDIAGLNDATGPLYGIYNVFILKLVLRYARSLRFLVPMSLSQIKESRGTQARKQLAAVKAMISGDYAQLAASIQPLITRGLPGDDEADIDLIRGTLGSQFQNDADAEIGLTRRSTDVQVRFDNDQDATDEDSKRVDAKVQRIQTFYDTFVAGFELFDPLDRAIPNADDDQAIKRAELLEKILNMPRLETSNVTAPLGEE